MRISTVFATATFLPLTLGMYFYLEGHNKKCFLESLPQEVTVIGKYSSERFDPTRNLFYSDPATGIQISVEEVANGHHIVNQKGPNEGTFTFTTASSSEHNICFQANTTGWMDNSRTKLHLNIVAGEHDDLTSTSQERIDDLVTRFRDLKQRIDDIIREQKLIQQREADFRNKSETTNGNVVWWTLLQLFVLAATCTWQMKHLKHFFEAKKLV